MTGAPIAAIGLMSGTSLDGIDAAWLETDGGRFVRPGPSLTVPYDEAFRARLRAILGGRAAPDESAAVERDLTRLHAAAVIALFDHAGGRPAAVIGFHGHTILHEPHNRRTWQIGDGGLLARSLGTPVVCDFRTDDVAAGGQGAPLVPIYHQAIAANLPRPVAILNIGGVANVTWLGEEPDQILAFDTGPGNALIDDWALRHIGCAVDQDGTLASAGQVDDAIVHRFLEHPFFGVSPPKSLDRNDFSHLLPHGLSPADGAATLAAITAGAVARAQNHFPMPPVRWLVTGGGRHNPVLMARLKAGLGVPVDPIEVIGFDGDALEAQAFAYLAVRHLYCRPLSFPGTTGVPSPQTGGVFYPPGNGSF